MEKIKKFILIIIPISLVLVVILIGLFFVYLQERERAYKIEDIQRQEYLSSKASSEARVNSSYSSMMSSLEQSAKREQYDICIQNAQKAYVKNWNTYCAYLKKGDDCALPTDKGKDLDDDRQKQLDTCLELYKAK